METSVYMTKDDVENIWVMFNPDQYITREEVVAILHAILKNNPRFKDYFARNISFSDLNKSKFVDSIHFCADQGFLAGCPDSSFSPKNKITRAKIAAVLSNIIDKF